MLQSISTRTRLIFATLIPIAFTVGILQGGIFAAPVSAQDSESDFQTFQSDENGIVYEVNVAELSKQRELLPLLDLIDWNGSLSDALGTPIRNIRTLGGAIANGEENPSTRMFLQSNRIIDGLAILRMNRLVSRNDVPETEEILGKTYFKFEFGGEKLGFYQPDDKTLVVNTLKNIEELVRGRRPKQQALRSKEWKDFNGYLCRIGIGEAVIDDWKSQYKTLNGRGMPSDPIMDLVSPLNKNVDKVFAGLRVEKVISFRVSIFGDDSSAAKEIESSLQALFQIGKATLGPAQEDIIASTKDETEKLVAVEGFKIFNQLVESIEFERIGKEVRITGEANFSSFVTNVLPNALASMRIAAKKQMSVNNLKQLTLGMQNYHDTQKQFPPAVIIGPNGHRHSWRVAILPYIDQFELYKQYRFDEPWDSPNNTKVMKQMPVQFRHPNDPASSTNTRYLVLTGPGTLFPKDGETSSLGDISDGSSNTIMFLSGATDVPWTKPEDIAYDPTKNISMENLPFKDGFSAARVDGSAEFYPKDFDPRKLHLLVQPSDGLPPIK